MCLSRGSWEQDEEYEDTQSSFEPYQDQVTEVEPEIQTLIEPGNGTGGGTFHSENVLDLISFVK